MKLLELFLVEYKRDITIQKMGDMIMKVVSRDVRTPTTIDNIFNILERMDPTKNKQYVEWICRQYIKGMFRIEDAPRVFTVMTQFENAKKTNQPVERDVNRYDFRTLQDAMDKLYNTEVKGEKQEGMFPVVYGSKVIYNGPLGQLAIPHTEEAAKELGKKTKWCTAWEEDNRFNAYHESGRIYTWRGVDGSRYQFHFDIDNGDISAMDGKDNPIDPKTFKYLRTQHPVLSKFLTDTFEPYIARQAFSSIEYAVYYLHGPFEAGEDAIIKAGDDKIEQYIKQALKGDRFPKYERVLLNYWSRTTVSKALNYMKMAQMLVWPELEKAIIERGDAAGAYRYANYHMRGRWPEAEHIIAREPKVAIQYMCDILEDKWPEAERYIIKDPNAAVDYAAFGLEGKRWPEAEPVIATDANASLEYAKRVIRGAWEEGENAMHSNPVVWKYYLDYLKSKSIPAPRF
jgi:hypothetical protein